MKSGDRVRMKCSNGYAYGEITIVRLNKGFIRALNKDVVICKVLFDGDDGPDYWYYPEKNLELVEK